MWTKVSGSGAAIVWKFPSLPTKMPESKLTDSSKAMLPTLFIEGRESLPSKSLVDVR
jgi:hypothetical protein